MSCAKRKKLTPNEQRVLDHGRVILLNRPEDCARCDEVIIEHHYLKDATLVGEHLRYAFVYKGQWLAVAAWAAAALHIKARDTFIGWTAEQCRARRTLIANNARLLVLPDCHYPNLISRFMKLMLARISQDWQAQWQHPLALVETFVDPQLFRGTAYKVSGWSHLGRTAGWKRDATDYYLKHNQPKQIWVKELARRACQKLRSAQLPPEWASVEARVKPRCTVKAPEIRSLFEHVEKEVPEFRRDQALAYPVTGLVALTRALLPKLIERKGQIINHSSVAASYPYKGGAVYAGTKAFVRQFSLDLRSDLAGTGVRVTSVEPGMAETEFTIVRTGGDKHASDKLYAGMDPMTPEDLADLFWWLANLPPHLNINTVELMPVSQSFAGFTVSREG